MDKAAYTVSLVGRPNVGKSTLFNRITGTRRAITHGVPGVTRDLVAGEAEHGGIRFRIVDTGGYVTGGEGDLLPKVRAQVIRAIYESDAIVVLVDARDGLLPLDREIVAMLRERGKVFHVAANKVDAREGREGTAQFHALGVEKVHPISAEHGIGVSDLLDEVLAPASERSGEVREEGEAPAVPRVAVVGRQNVGKSTLVNALAGFERVIASEIPGTTRDAVDVNIRTGEQEYVLIDTAGIRPRRKTEDPIEKFSVLKSLESIRRCDVAVLMIDGPAGVTHQDKQILRHILDEDRAVVVAANKADLWANDESRRAGLRAVQEGLGHVTFAGVVPLVATTGRGVPLLFRKIDEAFASFRKRVPTPALNRMAEATVWPVPIPSRRGGNRALYMTQVGTMPPSFAVFVKDRAGIPESYTRYLQARIRDRFGFAGSPIRILYRER